MMSGIDAKELQQTTEVNEVAVCSKSQQSVKQHSSYLASVHHLLQKEKILHGDINNRKDYIVQ